MPSKKGMALQTLETVLGKLVRVNNNIEGGVLSEAIASIILVKEDVLADKVSFKKEKGHRR